MRILGITIPFLFMIAFSIFSWIKAREVTEEKFGSKIDNLSNDYQGLGAEDEKIKGELKTHNRRLNEVEKMQAVMKVKVENIDKKTDEIKEDVKEILRKVR